MSSINAVVNFPVRHRTGPQCPVFTRLDLMAAEQELDHFQTPLDSVKIPFRDVCDTSGLKITQINHKTTVWPRYDLKKTVLLKEIRNKTKCICASTASTLVSVVNTTHWSALIILV